LIYNFFIGFSFFLKKKKRKIQKEENCGILPALYGKLAKVRDLPIQSDEPRPRALDFRSGQGAGNSRARGQMVGRLT
jgi:hypothetical protein